jgi:hypothetical protein
VPIDLAAGARLDAVQAALTGWARVVAEERNRGVEPDGQDLIVVAARFLAVNLEWLRHKDFVDEVLREIGDCVSAMRSVTAGRRERIYLGTCGALIVESYERTEPLPGVIDEAFTTRQCEGGVYGSIGASKAVCKACGAKHDQDARITDRSEKAHGYTYTAAEIAAAYPGVVLAGTIRQWRRRGLLTVHGEVDGHRLYSVAEVLALVESARERQAGRRETAEMGA